MMMLSSPQFAPHCRQMMPNRCPEVTMEHWVLCIIIFLLNGWCRRRHCNEASSITQLDKLSRPYSRNSKRLLHLDSEQMCCNKTTTNLWIFISLSQKFRL